MVNKIDVSRHAPEEIDLYLKNLPAHIRATLEQMRKIIHEMAPGCTERVSYQIPIFRLGTDLVGISANRRYCSLHSMSPALIKALAADLKDVKVSGATLHFTPDAPLPTALIKKIVRARMVQLHVEPIATPTKLAS